MRAISLRTKFLAIIIGLILLLGLSVIILVSTKLSEKLSTELNKRGLFMAKSITEACAAPLLDDNIFKLQMTLNGFERGEEDIEYVFVLDKKGRVLAHTFGERFPIDLKEVNPVSPEQPYNIQPLITEKGRMIDFAVPILNGEMGVVHLGISEEPIRKSVAHAIMLILGTITAVLVLGCSVAFMITKIITKPISDLVRGTEVVSSGNLEYKVPVSTKDEIGYLALTFNKMTEKLYKTTVSRDELAKEITERKQAEDVLRESEERFRLITETIAEVFWMADVKIQRMFYISPSYERVWGRSRESLYKDPQSFLDAVHGEDRERVISNLELQNTWQPFDHEYRIIRPDGSIRWIWDRGFPAQGETGQITWYVGVAQDITERKRAEEALRESEKRFKLAAESSTDLIYEWDIKERLDWFGKIDELLGYSPSEFPRTFEAWANSVHPEDRDRVMVAVKNHLEKNEPFNIEYRVRKKDGTYNYWWVRGNAVRDEKGNPYRWVGAITDITEPKRAEEMLQKSESKYRTLVENLPQKIFLKDLDSIYISCNEHYANDLRIAPADIAGKTDYDFYPKELAEKYRADDKRIMELGQMKEIEEEYIQDGRDVWINTIKTPLMDDNGKLSGLLGIFWDTTERKRAEEMLGASEERYRTLFEGAAEGIMVADIESKQFKYVNPATCRMLGYTAEELTRLSLADIHPKEALDYVVAEFEAQARGEKTLSPEIPCLRKDGSVIYTSVVTAPVVIDGHKCNVGFFTDITERKRAEDVLRESEERSRSLIETSPDMIVLIDFSGKIIVMNGVALTTYGYESKDELIGKNVLDFVIPEDRPRVLQEISKVLEVKTLRNLEYTSLKKDGSTFSIEVSASLILDAQQKPTSIVIMIRNITERKRATAELVNLNKQLEAAREAAESASRAKGEFLASMSHEIRTPLNAVIGMLGLLSTSELSGPHREYVEIAHSSADGLLVIINDILDFSKIEAGKLLFEPVPFDLLRVVEETIDMMVMKTREKGLDLTVQYGPDVPRHFIGDSGRIRQVLINLVNNAIKFTHKGHVLIDVRAEEPMNEEVLLRITVEDTGIGISSDKLDSLFKPFVQADASTTRRYGGTGLGLAISKRLVEMMGGTIGASSRSGEGSAFWYTLRLPLDKEFTGVALPLTDLSGVRVLIADSYEVDRRVLQEHLVSWGIGNDSCVSGEEVLTMLREAYAKGEPYQVALIDYQMPDIPGETLGRAIKADRVLGETVLIMLTSWKQRGHCDCIREAGFASCLSKPIRPSQLLEVLTVAWETWNQGVVHKRTVPHIPAEFLVTQTALPKTARWGRPLRVLVVEDNVVNQRVTMLMLTELGCHVDLAANGREAVEMIELLPFDMVFMDCEMPEMDGFEATREIRRLQGDKHLPIIAMTAYALQGDRERCLAAGMDDYFSKPVKLEDFQAALERWGPKDSRSFEGRLKPPASLEKAPLTVENETSSVIDPNVIARLRGLADATDPSLLTRIFHLFLSDTPERITTLRKAAATGDTAGLSKAAHSLRGACASIGVMGMVEICKTLESLGHGKYVDGAMALVEKLETEFNQVKVEIEREIADDRLALLSTAGKKDENI
jgi:two-component system, sensor histidine kinase and response regulator